MRWRVNRVRGWLGSLTAAEALAEIPARLDGQGRSQIIPRLDCSGPALLWARLQPLLDGPGPKWVILPHSERRRWDWWQARLDRIAKIGFGRAEVALALSQLNGLGRGGRLLAVYSPGPGEPGIEGVLALDWVPDDYGLAFQLSQMDGRLDGQADVGALLQLGRRRIAQPEVLLCPGTGGDGYLERLLPFLAQLGPWAEQEVRWEFPEAALGRLGVVGSLFNWAWLEAGYRLGDWAGPSAVIEMDESPLVGLSVVNWTSRQGTA